MFFRGSSLPFLCPLTSFITSFPSRTRSHMWAYLCFLSAFFSFILSFPTWLGFWQDTYTYISTISTLLYLKVPPNVGVQKSTVVPCVTGNVLETGTKHSPRLLRSCFGPWSGSLDLSEFCINKIKNQQMQALESAYGYYFFEYQRKENMLHTCWCCMAAPLFMYGVLKTWYYKGRHKLAYICLCHRKWLALFMALTLTCSWRNLIYSMASESTEAVSVWHNKTWFKIII